MNIRKEVAIALEELQNVNAPTQEVIDYLKKKFPDDEVINNPKTAFQPAISYVRNKVAKKTGLPRFTREGMQKQRFGKVIESFHIQSIQKDEDQWVFQTHEVRTFNNDVPLIFSLLSLEEQYKQTSFYNDQKKI